MGRCIKWLVRWTLSDKMKMGLVPLLRWRDERMVYSTVFVITRRYSVACTCRWCTHRCETCFLLRVMRVRWSLTSWKGMRSSGRRLDGDFKIFVRIFTSVFHIRNRFVILSWTLHGLRSFQYSSSMSVLSPVISWLGGSTHRMIVFRCGVGGISCVKSVRRPCERRNHILCLKP